MKIKNLLATLLLMASTSMMADDLQYLTISYNGSEESHSLPVVQRISFEDDYLVVTMTSGGRYSYPLSIVEKITFTETATAIEALPEAAKGLEYKDGKLDIKGNGMLCVYSSSGSLVSIANVKEGANVSLNGLPAGVYIVRMGDKTIKIKK